MKRLLAIFLAVCTIGSLSGCVSRSEDGSSSVPPSSSSSPDPSSVQPSSSEESSLPDLPDEEGTQHMPTMSTDFDKVAALDTTKVQWGPGTQRDEKNRSQACLQLQEQYGKYNVNFIGPDEKKIYLTFDEGYENGNTARILDVLKEKEVSAVFFVTGHYVNTNPELVQRMIDEGHIVGNHSDKHPLYHTLSPEEAFNDLNAIHELVQEKFDYTMHLFRYPAGEFSEQTLALLADTGYQTAFWSFAYADWNDDIQPDAATSYKKLVDALCPGNIYLLHAVSATNADILGDFIDEARAQGYEVSRYDIPPTTASEEAAANSSSSPQ